MSIVWDPSYTILPDCCKILSTGHAQKLRDKISDIISKSDVRLWVKIKTGQYAGTIGEIKFVLPFDTYYDTYGYLKNRPIWVHTKDGSPFSIKTASGSNTVWDKARFAVTRGEEVPDTVFKKAIPKSKKVINAPKIYDHFGEPIVPGSIVILPHYQSTTFGRVTDILESGSFRWKMIKTRITSLCDSEYDKDRCYTNSTVDVVVVGNNMLDTVLMKRLEL